ncbi:tRNA pseudouridine synthase-like 1 [Solea senegalensis]|uniref:tRNA pseudouridine synthase n=1 Tax=Solea senegalensis TaxID=28829 RepID=A0AAV6QNY4_SOLSE|nr:tRNA pseudouridine synthase-like 1 isoform X2 [Solea senegalensis]KAG7494888.1 tRNA pseudouridine synthase-like 1 [Solea senegalensis]
MHSCTRYLIFFQYIGTKYSGAAKVHQQHKTGVLDHLEDAVRKLKPLNPVSLTISSRTDSGVHALSNSAHFDIQRTNNKPPFTEDILVEALNYHLETEQIRITHAHRVPDNFHARFRAISRTYVYRIALGLSRPCLLPLTDHKLCWSLRNTDIPMWELTFRSRSFLYRQVRRMTGALVAVGRGQLSVTQLKDLLEAQDPLAYQPGMAAPAHGLFLTRVDYRDADMQLSQQTGNSED